MKRRFSKKGGSRADKAADRRASSQSLTAGYRELLDDLKARVRAAQIKAAVAASRELIQLYWDIGRLVVERQLPAPKVPQPVRQMSRVKVAQAVRQLGGLPLPESLAKIPWGHNVVLMEKRGGGENSPRLLFGV